VPNDTAHRELSPLVCAQAFGVGVQGHDVGTYNGTFRRVGVHESQPRFERSLPDGSTLHLYYHGPSAAWFLKGSFTPEQASRKSWVASASGALPTGLQTWQNGGNSNATDGWADLSLTLTLLVRASPLWVADSHVPCVADSHALLPG
jgi:hypothetical protein